MRIHIQIKQDNYKPDVSERVKKALESLTKEPVVVRINASNKTNQVR